MRYSELAGKEIISLAEGERLGIINDTDLVLDTDRGRVEAVIIPDKRRGLGFLFRRHTIELPWKSILKIGVDLIIIDKSTGRESPPET